MVEQVGVSLEYILIRTKPLLIGSRIIDDWRYRKSRDKILTTLTVSDYLGGDAEPGDDIVEVGWFPLSSYGEVLVPEHHVLKDMLAEYLLRTR